MWRHLLTVEEIERGDVHAEAPANGESSNPDGQDHIQRVHCDENNTNERTNILKTLDGKVTENIMRNINN